MTKRFVQITPDYIYHFTTRDWNGYRNLTIHSQWLGAKDPQGLQERVSINLDEASLKALLDVLSN